MRSGELADAAGVNRQTLRYYERRGLLRDPGRSLGGHRDYGLGALTILRAIRAAQRLGFTLEEIKELLAIGSHEGPRPGLDRRAREKLGEVDAKIAALQTMRADLLAVIDAGCADLRECTCDPRCPIPFSELAADQQAARDARSSGSRPRTSAAT